MKNYLLSFTDGVDRKIRWIFAFVSILLALFFVALFQQKRTQQSAREWVDKTYQIVRKTDSIGVVVAESEAGTILYQINHSDTLKSQIQKLHQHLNNSILELGALTSDNQSLQYQIRKLQQLCIEMEGVQNNILGGETSQKNEKVNEISKTIRVLLNSIREVEKGMLSGRILQSDNSFKNSINTSLISSVLAFILVIAILIQLNMDISLRKKAEKEISLSEEKYRSLIENAGVVMYTTDHRGLINFANNQVTQLTGYSTEELNGKHFSILLDPSSKDKVSKFYANQFDKKIAATYLEFLTMTKSGSYKWVEQSAQLLFDHTTIIGYQCMVRDITERKYAEKELSESEAKRKENEYRLNAILDNSTALIYIKDLEGRYILANRKFKEFMKLNDQQLIGRTDFDINPKALAEKYRASDTEVITTLKPIEREEVVETSEGTRNLLLLKFPLITPDNVLLGVSGIATDVTEKLELQKEHYDALLKAEAAQQVQEQFLANMSHEIRTPMNGIQGMTRLMLETALTDEQKRFANIISRSLNNLVVIVNNVLDYSNLKTGKLVLDQYAFDLIEILEEVKKHFEHSLSNKKLPLHLKIAENVPRVVKGDAHRLKQILTNLVGNAIKFTNDGEINLEMTVREIAEEKIDVEFKLSDTGIGIPKEKLDTIFESFVQAGKKISSDYGGAGLGLTISKGLIELQSGSISVTSEQGVGSVFTFHIPFGVTKKNEIISSQSDYEENLAGKKVLVVEDNQVNQRLIDFVLKKVNVTADLASNGKEAISFLEKDPSYDLIIMDLQMPVMDGYETTIHIREQMKLKMPIIAMTATALKEDQERCAKVGMNDFMIKPFDFNDLYTRMTRLLFHLEIKGPTKKQIAEPRSAKGYSFSVLEELEDNNYLIEVVSFFLENIPIDINELKELEAQKNWEALFRKAHKIKSASALLCAYSLTDKLAMIESRARNLTNLDNLKGDVKEAQNLFEEIEPGLRNDLTALKNEAEAAAKKN